jgi:PAS domain S-box-containing protein
MSDLTLSAAPRGRLLRKYVVVFVGLVGGVLMASSLVELYFTYQETKRAIVREERAKATAAAAQIERFVKEVERQVRETTRAASDDPAAAQLGQGKLAFRGGLGAALAEQRELDFLRLLRDVPAISELSHLDVSGKEQLRVSRLALDAVGSQEDFSQAPKFLEARSGKTYWSPVYLRNGVEPYLTLAVPVGQYAVEITTAEISLKAVQQAIAGIQVGRGGYAFVVDSRGRLFAHPDLRLVRQNRDLSALPQVRVARAERLPAPGGAGAESTATVAEGLRGGQILAAHAAIAPLGWLVLVERPLADAYAPLRAPLVRSAVIFLLGLGISVLASLVLARRMIAPIRVLQAGAARIGAGDLDHRIAVRTGDELERLAEAFNRAAAQLEDSYANLEQKVEARTRELADANAGLTEALEQQTATSEILRVISSSPIDVQPVFDTIAQSSMRLCDAAYSVIGRYDGQLLHLAAEAHVRPEGVEPLRQLFPMRPNRATTTSRAILDRAVVHVPDVLEDPDYARPVALAIQNRSTLAVPMLREGEPIGTISVGRLEPRPFTEKQIQLLQTFADQAVIAIENVRLFTELQEKNRALTEAHARVTEALEQQTATSEILRVISSSPTDVQPVFDTIARSAVRLCHGQFGGVFRFDGERVHLLAQDGLTPEGAEVYLSAFPRPAGRDSAIGRAVLDRAIIHIQDVHGDAEYGLTALAQVGSMRCIVAVPLLRESTPIGGIVAWRSRPDPFSDKQIELLKTFADQAVIAIENVRLFTELEARNRELTEALEQQTATAEILRAISGSPTDIQPVLDTVVRAAARFCGATDVAILRLDGNTLRGAAGIGPFPDLIARQLGTLAALEIPVTRGSVTGRAVVDRRTVHVHDLAAEPEGEFPEGRELQRRLGHRTMAATPLLREGTPLGVIALFRMVVDPFSEKQLDQLRVFADQAVIAIENVRLFTELQARNRDLTETLEQQTATAEILRVISGSPTDVRPVFDAVAASAARLCESFDAAIFRRDSDRLLLVAHHGPIPLGAVGEFSLPLVRGTAPGRAVLDRRPIHVPDMQTETAEFPESSANARRMGFRANLCVPLMREGEAIGVIALRRTDARLFTDRQVDLLRTFADQAVIAIENVRLFQELEARNRDLTETLEQQTATSEILRVISRSPRDVQPVFDTIARSAAQLCEAEFCFVFRFDGELLHFVAHEGLTPQGYEALRGAWPRPPSPGTAAGRSVLDRSVAHIPDVHADPNYVLGAVAEVAAYRSTVGVPMLRDGVPIGTITVSRSRSGPFSSRQIILLQTFADQAVIAVENVRLFQELEARNRDLTETLEQQTATSEILRVISRSPTDVQPVFDTIARSAKRLCAAQFSLLYRFDGTLLHFVAHHGLGPEALAAVRRAYPMAPSRASTAARAVLSGTVEQIPDVDLDPDYGHGTVARAIGSRSMVGVPMVRDGVPTGCIVVARAEVGPFPERHLELLRTFADQAVIAVENVRLFQELEARTRELTRSVGELRALGEVSRAVSSTLDLETVLATIVTRAVELSGSQSGIIYEFDEPTETFRARASHHITPDYLEVLRATPIRLGEGAMGRAGEIREPVEVSDVEDERQVVAPQVRAMLARQGTRSLLAVPLVREDRLLGGLVVLRQEPGAFSPEVVATLQTFAAQSVLAIHNAGLFREIQRQKQYADALVETSPVAIATMDLDGKVVGWNPGAERLFGHTETEALGRHMEDLVATPETREEVRANIRQTLAGEGIRAIGRRARKDGTPLDVEISSMPVVVEGARVGMIGIYHDITDLLRARREAEAATEAKSAFLATMSHEIRTPMNAVIGMSGLLLNTALSDEQREYAEIVRQSGDALLTVINDILDFSKIEAGRLELESQPFDLMECIEGALDLVATRAAEKGLDLAYLVGDGTPAAIVGDVTRLRQVLLNLLTNAVKFTERGEVVLSVAARRLDGASPLHELTFLVRDTGIGIPPDRLGRLFQSFSQVDASTTRRYGGTGLGLAISQRLAELMGGRISVTSEVGTGSEFRLTIQAAAAEGSLPARRDLSGVQPSLRGNRVLVVDDNATNRRILTAHLDAWGMRARATGSPGEALGWIAADEPFDVGILDMHMPEMDGIALARAIRAHPAGTALPLVLFTSLGRREARAAEEGFAAYLHKPIKPSQLFDALVSVLAERPVHVRERGVTRSELAPDMARRHPLRILLAEDNVVNQKVALRLLGQMGYRADVAGNGLEAIDAVERQTYDLILMDVQMPELDGFEASREINRRWPGALRPRIVAMTANAMQGDRELCAAAGMDDYVAKPIRVEELVAALERSPRRPDAAGRGAPAAHHTGTGGRPGSPRASEGRGAEPGPGGPAGPTTTPVIDRTTVERLTTTMGGAFVGELIDTFAADARALIAALRQTLAEADLDAFRRAAHSLKSTSESLGAIGLAARARELEAIARAGSLDGAGDRVTQLVGAYEIVARELEELRRGLPA